NPTSTHSISDLLGRRESLHALMNPMGLGNFGVLVQGKNLSEAQRQLRGLSLPA
ncbi:MAG: class I SAM-dependent methyltransferase, partial [Microcoleus sp. SIO2G3]|nr:class I SAM-dependent methyltransferase [Microcoleus sp. SIO2G3]